MRTGIFAKGTQLQRGGRGEGRGGWVRTQRALMCLISLANFRNVYLLLKAGIQCVSVEVAKHLRHKEYVFGWKMDNS